MLPRFHRSRVCGNRLRTALAISINNKCNTHILTDTQTEGQTDGQTDRQNNWAMAPCRHPGTAVWRGFFAYRHKTTSVTSILRLSHIKTGGNTCEAFVWKCFHCCRTLKAPCALVANNTYPASLLGYVRVCERSPQSRRPHVKNMLSLPPGPIGPVPSRPGLWTENEKWLGRFFVFSLKCRSVSVGLENKTAKNRNRNQTLLGRFLRRCLGETG